MTRCEDDLFSYSDLATIAPWLTEETCRELGETGLFTPRMPHRAAEVDLPRMNLHDLIALTCVQQLLRCGISADQLRKALYDPSFFRCDGFSEGDLLFLSTGGFRGQELSRFLEVTDADVTILIRLPLAGEPVMEIIPDELLDPKDFRGETLTAVECRAIRDIIRGRTASTEHNAGKGESDARVHPQA